MIVNRKKLAFFLLLILSLGLSGCGFFSNKEIITEESKSPALFRRKVKLNRDSVFLNKDGYEFSNQKDIRIPEDIYQGHYEITTSSQGKIILFQDSKKIYEQELYSEESGIFPLNTILDIQSGETMEVEGNLVFRPVKAKKSGDTLHNGCYIAGRDFSEGGYLLEIFRGRGEVIIYKRKEGKRVIREKHEVEEGQTLEMALDTNCEICLKNIETAHLIWLSNVQDAKM